MIGRIVFSLAGLLWLTASAMDHASERVRYTLRFPQPETHYVEVEASFPADRREQIELMMPVWTPGSYLVRDYSRHVESIAASAGDRALKISKTRKNRWTVETSGGTRVDVRYRVYGFELGVQTNWIGSEFAMLNGAATFLSLAEKTPRPQITMNYRLPGKRSPRSHRSAGRGESSLRRAGLRYGCRFPDCRGQPHQPQI